MNGSIKYVIGIAWKESCLVVVIDLLLLSLLIYMDKKKSIIIFNIYFTHHYNNYIGVFSKLRKVSLHLIIQESGTSLVCNYTITIILYILYY